MKSKFFVFKSILFKDNWNFSHQNTLILGKKLFQWIYEMILMLIKKIKNVFTFFSLFVFRSFSFETK
jgi:hypothetical protein